MTIFGDWLKATRERQKRSDGEPWSQDDFLAELERATGWHLHRPNYSNYETGHTNPKRPTIAKLIGFWTARGEPGPDLTPPPTPEPVADPMERIAAAVEEIARHLGELRKDMAGQSGATIGAVQTLGAQLSAILEGMQGGR